MTYDDSVEIIGRLFPFLGGANQNVDIHLRMDFKGNLEFIGLLIGIVIYMRRVKVKTPFIQQ